MEDEILDLLIKDKIELLSDISAEINHIFKKHPEIKNAPFPSIEKILLEETGNGWIGFRESRAKKINNFKLHQCLEKFPLCLFDLSHLGSFKIHQNDCDDMVVVLENMRERTPYLVRMVFSRVDDLVARYYLSMGYAQMKVERREINRRGAGACSSEIGKITVDNAKKALEILGGIKGYDALPRGNKKKVRDDVQTKCKLKDPRHVYTILSKIRSLDLEN